MKKAILVSLVVGSLTLISCGGTTSEPVVTDSTAVDTVAVDTVAVDSAVVVKDTVKK